MRSTSKRSMFTRFAKITARASGTPAAFLVAVGVIIVWVVSGPLFRFSDSWMLAINTTTTIVTFLMVFLIQNTQNRDAVATQVKLDELLRATQGAHNALLDLEDLAQEDLDAVRRDYCQLAKEARQSLRQGTADTGKPEVANSSP